MRMRTIMIFPKFENIEIINNIRRKYDPLNELVKPHITIAFPFESEVSDEELKGYLEVKLKDIKPFRIVLQGFSKREDKYGNYLFLNLKEGMKELKQIHNLIYNEILKEFKIEDEYEYEPHMTVGKLQTYELLEKALEDVAGYIEKFECIVEKISVEMIGVNEESIIIIENKL